MIDLILSIFSRAFDFFDLFCQLNLPEVFFSLYSKFHNTLDEIFRCEMLDHAKWRPGIREESKVITVAPFNDSRKNIATLRVLRLMPWSYYIMLLGSHCAPPWLIDSALIANKFLTRGLHTAMFIDLHYYNVAIMEQTGYWTQLQNFYDINSGAKPAYKAIMAATKDLEKKQYEEICIIAEKLLWQQGDWFWEEETVFYAAESERVKQAIETLTKIVEAHLPAGSYIKADMDLIARDPWESQQYSKAVKLKEEGPPVDIFKVLLFVVFGFGVFLLAFSQVISFLVLRANKKKKEQVVIYLPLPPVYYLPAPKIVKQKKQKKVGRKKKLNLRRFPYLFFARKKNNIYRVRKIYRLNKVKWLRILKRRRK